MWKFIISPEFGDRIDLNRLARELMSRIQKRLGTGRVGMVAVVHYNININTSILRFAELTGVACRSIWMGAI